MHVVRKFPRSHGAGNNVTFMRIVGHKKAFGTMLGRSTSDTFETLSSFEHADFFEMMKSQ